MAQTPNGPAYLINLAPLGANRGIGFNLVKAFIAESWEVTGTVRPQTRADNDPTVGEVGWTSKLILLAVDFPHLCTINLPPKLEKTGAKILELDYLDEATIEKAAAAYGDRALDMLVNLGGLPPKPRHWHEQTADIMVEKFRVMTVGPIITTKHFLPKLERAPDAKIVTVSSAFGSVSSQLISNACLLRRRLSIFPETEIAIIH